LGCLALSLQYCARDLVRDGQIAPGPKELNQNFETLSEENIEKIVVKKHKAEEVRAKSKPKVVTKGKNNKSKEPAQRVAEDSAIWIPKRWPYGLGEKASYVLRWGLIEGGIATIEVKDMKVLDGEPVIHYQADAKSSKVLDFIYKVHDTVDTWVGLADHLPRRQELRQNESGRWGKRVVVFNHEKKAVSYYSHTTKKDGQVVEIRRDDPLENYPQDIFGAIFFYRFADSLQNLNFPVHDRWKHWSNEMIFEGKERIQLPAGEFDTVRYKMNPRITGQFKPQADVKIWFRDDDSKFMLKFKAKIRIGWVTGEMKSYSPGKKIDLPLPKMKTPTNLSRLGKLPK